ncbi:acyl transferase/acyl hydrolase/lysophospholipase [Xylaria venustula]|nr:acyl transferase/acyl hydrolase/lysophospholipase [Xylaria venustula]
MAGPSTTTPNLHIADTHDQVANRAPGPWFQKIALSFDGGGVRGYWSLLVLQHLMLLIQTFEREEDGKTRSSFHPCEKPINVSQLPNLNNLDNTPFLPCHYFDYIGGTSTGALIAILLSRFRMTVEDCLKEYETMAGVIFGNPRMFHKLKGFVKWNKYSTKDLEKAIKEVIERRSQVSEDDTEPLFQTDIDTCRGVVLATQLRDGQAVTKRFLFRSYTSYSERRHANAQSNENLHLKNPNEGMRISLLKVARAGTAAPFYFGHYHTVLSTTQAQAAERVRTNGTIISRTATSWTRRQNDSRIPEGKSSYIFQDAGFSSANNPCWELYREIQYHHGDNQPVLVSIGTARPKDEFEGEGAVTTIKRGLHQLGNPEEVHELLEPDKDKGNYFYYRLNDEDGIRIEMDEWKPKKVGSDTIRRMTSEFHNWLRKDGVEERFRECARHLVRLRRVRMKTPRWERFALGQYFVCQMQNCPKDRDNQWLDRGDFENHLTREHREEDYGGNMDSTVDSCRRIWRYRQRQASS